MILRSVRLLAFRAHAERRATRDRGDQAVDLFLKICSHDDLFNVKAMRNKQEKVKEIAL